MLWRESFSRIKKRDKLGIRYEKSKICNKRSHCCCAAAVSSAVFHVILRRYKFPNVYERIYYFQIILEAVCRSTKVLGDRSPTINIVSAWMIQPRSTTNRVEENKNRPCAQQLPKKIRPYTRVCIIFTSANIRHYTRIIIL